MPGKARSPYSADTTERTPQGSEVAKLDPFMFAEHPVRAMLIDGEPVFVHADVCGVLEIGNPSDVLRRLDPDERTLVSIDGPNGRRVEVNAVTESGLYALILGSRKPQARPFKRWVTHEVLPALRRTGRYDIASAPRLPQSYAEALRELAAKVEQNEAQAVRIKELTPAATSWNTLATASGDLAVADAAKVLSRDPDVKIGRGRLFAVMADLGWIYRQGIDGRWRCRQTAIETGRLMALPQSHYHPRTGALVMDPPQVRVTVKGLEFLHQHLGGVS